jgi:hypothetical protein
MNVALYARVSDPKEKRGTIESQIEALRAFAGKNGHDVVESYVCRDRYTSVELARPELDRLRDGAEAGAFEAVLVYDPDRLSRKYAYQILILPPPQVQTGLLKTEAMGESMPDACQADSICVHALVSGRFQSRWRVPAAAFPRYRLRQEVFRRLLLERLHEAERLSETFMRNLLSWVHPGFSVFAGPALDNAAESPRSNRKAATSPAPLSPCMPCKNSTMAAWPRQHLRARFRLYYPPDGEMNMGKTAAKIMLEASKRKPTTQILREV